MTILSNPFRRLTPKQSLVLQNVVILGCLTLAQARVFWHPKL